MGAFWPPDRGGGQGGDGGVRREVNCGKPNNAKVPGGSGAVSYLQQRKQSTICNRPGQVSS